VIDLELVAKASEADEWINRIEHLPLKLAARRISCFFFSRTFLMSRQGARDCIKHAIKILRQILSKESRTM
jgi:hypothetical protein